jgi:hypothetical protein
MQGLMMGWEKAIRSCRPLFAGADELRVTRDRFVFRLAAGDNLSSQWSL